MDLVPVAKVSVKAHVKKDAWEAVKTVVTLVAKEHAMEDAKDRVRGRASIPANMGTTVDLSTFLRKQ